MTTNTLKGLFKIRTYAIFQPIYAVIVLLTFLFLVFAKHLISFKSIIYPTLLGYGIISIVLSVFFLRKYFKFWFDKTWANTLTGYSMFAAIGGLSFVFYTNIDKILINKYLTVGDVGIYRAYSVASVNITVLLWAMFNTIFFPTVSRYKDKGIVFNRISKLIPYLISLGTPFILFCEFIILKLYGSKYPMDLVLMLMFAFAAILVVWYGLYDWTFCSKGVIGVKIGLLGTVTIAVLNFLLNIYLIPHFALYGAIGANIVSFASGIYCLYALKSKIT
jgi:O-antigen/teichoic acid export membrane protein